MSKRGDKEYILDIVEAINRITQYTATMEDKTFWSDTKTQDAVVRNLEIIGEAAKNISENIRIEKQNIPWKSLSGVRDRLIHQYFGVNLDIVWSIVKDELPSLTVQIKDILKNF